MSSSKKIILFIVEGLADKTALEKIFKSIYRSNKTIDFKFTDGDISSNDSVTINNACDKVYSYVYDYLKDRKLKKSDIWKIIQVFDTDGTFIPDTAIGIGVSNNFVYTPTQILCKDIERVKERNAKKCKIMNYLIAQTTIKEIPFECYFMSCNLDHALYNVQNLPDDKKIEYADNFYEHFLNNERLFIKFLDTDVVNGTPKDYRDSWKYIQKDLHSLERHTNLNIFFILNHVPPLI